jgi:hypothetical protein
LSLELFSDIAVRRCEVRKDNSQASGEQKVDRTPLPCAAGPALLGEAAMRRKDQRGRWGEVPKSD